MIASLRGRIAHKDAAGVVLECGGVGYGVLMSLTGLGHLGDLGSDAHLHVYTHVGQDVLRLYGFAEAAEKRAFEILIGVTGIGPRLALALLSSLTPGELAGVVQKNDLARLTTVPGVGKKTGERLLLELRGKLPASSEDGAPGPGPSLQEDLVSALISLGFQQPAAERAAAHTLDLHPKETDLALLVRTALRSATHKG